MRSWINDQQITVYHSVPSLFRRFAETLPASETFSSVRVVKLGGEPVFASDVDLFRRHFRRDCILILSNSVRAEHIIVMLVNRLLGPVNLPAEWEGYAPAKF